MNQRKRTAGRHAVRQTADLSRQPDAQDDKAPRAPAPSRRSRPEKPSPAGPGGLGYVLGLEKHEVAEIRWRGEEHPAPAPPTPGRPPVPRRPRRER